MDSVFALGVKRQVFESPYADQISFKFMDYLHSFLTFLLLISSLSICTSFSIMECVLYLILCFCNCTGILFLFHSDFLGVLFVIVYVGAIAVLFLFVVMMLNTKVKRNNLPLGKFLFLVNSCFLSIVFFLLSLGNIFHNIDNIMMIEEIDIVLLIDELSNIQVLAQVLFNHYFVAVLLSGFILLIALVGSIILTLKFGNWEPSQDSSRQLSRKRGFSLSIRSQPR